MEYYLFISLHLISVVVWIVSIAYLSRLILLQYDSKNILLEKESEFIYKKIASPAFLSTISFGIVLLSLNKALLESGIWIYIKFLFVSLIIILHHLCKIYLNQILQNKILRSRNYLSSFSLFLFIFVAIIIVLTIIKPF